jgi:hypothetical protein
MTGWVSPPTQSALTRYRRSFLEALRLLWLPLFALPWREGPTEAQIERNLTTASVPAIRPATRPFTRLTNTFSEKVEPRTTPVNGR